MRRGGAGWSPTRTRRRGARLAAAPPGGDRFVVRPRSFCSVGAQNRLFSLSRLIDDREMRAGRATSRCGAADSHGMDSIASNSGRWVGPAKLGWAGGSAARDGPGPEWVSAVRVGSATAAGCAAAVRAGSSPAAGCAAAAGWVRDRARCVGFSRTLRRQTARRAHAPERRGPEIDGGLLRAKRRAGGRPGTTELDWHRGNRHGIITPC